MLGLGIGRQLLFNKEINVTVKVINIYNEIENVWQPDSEKFEPFTLYIKTYIGFNYILFFAGYLVV
jgi:hypothetical protein